MNKKKLRLLAVGLTLLVVLSAAAAYIIWANQNKEPPPIRVACVGDSLTQSTEYPYDLWNMLGRENYLLLNFGAGSTTVSLSSDTPYMNTTVFQDALDFQPDIVIIMLGTNDAQPSLFQYNSTFVADYITLVNAFKELPSKPEIWLVLPPPIFSNQSGKISPEYFSQTIIPGINQAAAQTSLPVIDVYSALINYPQYFPDGLHPEKTTGEPGNEPAAKIIASEIYTAITSQPPPA